MPTPTELMLEMQPATEYATRQAGAPGINKIYKAITGGAAKSTTARKSWLGELIKGGKKSLKSSGIEGILPYAILYYLYAQAQKGASQQAQMGLQAEGLEQQANMITPEALMYQAAVGPAQEEEAMSRMMLVNKLMGATGPSLARGEERI